MMVVAGVSFAPALGCEAVGWQFWGALLVCLFMWVLQDFVGIVGWLSLADVVGAACCVSVVVAVGWPVLGGSVDCANRMMVEKCISMMVWDSRRWDLLGRAG
jgi:hypothetical protein